MPIENELLKLKSEVDKELEVFFSYKIRQIEDQKKPEELLEAAKNLKSFVLNSGKRIRPILFYYGYLVAGGKDIEKILKTAIAVEFIHSYLLIHDDIIDQDDFRHGGLSMHCKYKEKYKDEFKNKDLKHFGTSMAIIVGDLTSVFGYEILTNSDFPLDLKVKAISKLNSIVSNTLTGEAMDVVLGMNASFSKSEIIEMQKYKTAKYTIEGPLHLGAILAGAGEKLLESLSRFAIPLGIAFQIQDDIIGIFGDEKKIGKPMGSDIIEGKKTLLIAEALERADDEQKEIIYSSLGNRSISLDDVEKVRNIIKETGSLDYSRKKAEELVKLSKKRLEEIEISDSNNKRFLSDLADFVVRREY
jgi:geranylgeranyl diphosphate synthase type I